MKRWYDPRTEFSPYEFGVAQSVTFGLLGIIMVALIATPLRQLIDGRAVFTIFFLGIVVLNILYWLSKCPNCGKSATRQRLLSWRNFDGLGLFQIQRSWPERICEDCGHDLTRISARP
ncbi:MAG: hypothetical protein JWN66_4277 [Sphingomonas bacterium]|uniref:hypothetical protein n=1 Tax=Sphingomonas bacterium TaxID=1895847 RepID=UPI00260276D4|nr:hypothetical protein [Sphingomonas bacterium]MDB5707161.1 hypothetical protein [Sphingomonas bacterium]